MSVVLRKSSYSPNIKERADFSCAIFDQKSRMVAQAEAIPVHLGSFGFVARPILNQYQDVWQEGDAIILNSPRAEYGGTHLPDISLLAPVFVDGKLQYIVANRAHHADVGGMAPGSLPGNSTEVFQEGLIIPPLRLYKEGVEDEEIMRFILENVRTPDERRGDLRAQYASLMTGVNRLKTLISSETWNFEQLNHDLLAFSNQGTLEKLRHLPHGESEFCDYLDSNGVDQTPVKICCRVTIDSGGITFDFSKSDNQQEGNVNAPVSITTAAVYYVIRLIVGREVPTNEGCFDAIKIIAPQGLVINPRPNAATSSANTETSSRIVDVVMGAIAKLIPFPAASQGTMNNLLLGGQRDYLNKPWTIYETIGGGSGAFEGMQGTSAIHTHMTNTLNTPIEALELAYPLRIRQYAIRNNSFGDGKYPGGNGIIREIELLDDAILSLQTERRSHEPWGMQGGKNGKSGKNTLVQNGKEFPLPGRITKALSKGDIVRIETPGGGGYGDVINSE